MQLTHEMAERILRLEKEKDRLVEEARATGFGALTCWSDLVNRAQGFNDCLIERSMPGQIVEVSR